MRKQHLLFILIISLILAAPAAAFEKQAFASTPPPKASSEMKALVGEYIRNSKTADEIMIFEKGGKLFLDHPNGSTYPLDRIKGSYYITTGPGSRAAINLMKDPGGKVNGLKVNRKFFVKIYRGNENGESFKIKPTAPIEELRKKAMKGKPPLPRYRTEKPDFVDVTRIDPTIKTDIRYATSNNFMGTPFYSKPKAYMQRPAAVALKKVSAKLKKLGYGLIVYDAYRPWFVTKMFWDATPEDKKQFVANPYSGSRHNRGAAVDLSLYYLDTGEPVEMPSGYDEFTKRAYPSFKGGTSRQRWHRELLMKVMEEEGFRRFAYEWWHFDFHSWKIYGIYNLTFEELEKGSD